MGLGFTGAAGGGDVRRPQARGDTSLKQRRRVRAKLPPRLTFCPTLRHEGQIKIRRGGNRITPRTCWHLARPWKSSVCLVTVFTQPAGHTAHSGLPGQSGWSLGPPVPKAPASGPLPASTPASGPWSHAPHGGFQIPAACPKTGDPPGTPQIRFRSLSTLGAGSRAGVKGFGIRVLAGLGQAAGLRVVNK